MSARGSTFARRLPLALVLALAAGCGPNVREVSIAILVVALAIILLANAIAWPLWKLWHRLRPELEFRWRPFAIAGVVISSIGLVAEQLPYDGSMSECAILALWAVGTSYLTFLLLVWRLRLPAGDGLVIGHGVAGILMFAPALPLAFVGPTSGGFPDLLVFLWAGPGYAGIVPAILFGGLLLEVLLRRRRA